jgi:hypothetical protein
MRAYSLKLLADYSFPVGKRLSGTYPKRDDQTQFNITWWTTRRRKFR